MKKIFSLILSFVMISCIGLTVFAAETPNLNNSISAELGADEAFLYDKERQLEWENQVWENLEEKEVVGDWKSGARVIGSWSWRDGVICVTDSYASVDWFNNGHAGIVGISPYNYGVVEANPGDGVEVCYGSWVDRFGNGKVIQVGVTDTTTEQDHLAAEWATRQLGKPYEFPVLLSNRDKFYCSHLVYAAYLETCDVDLNTIAWPGFIHPFELFNNDLVTVIYNNEK